MRACIIQISVHATTLLMELFLTNYRLLSYIVPERHVPRILFCMKLLLTVANSYMSVFFSAY